MLLAQAKRLRDIKLDDFDADMAALTLSVDQLERQHTEALHSMDGIRDHLTHSKDKETWQESNAGTIIENAVKITKSLSDETGDKHWSDTHEKWRLLMVSYSKTDQLVKSLPGTQAAEDIDTFADQIERTFGGMWH